MIPHERTTLTAAEQETLRELERSLERSSAEPDHHRSWAWQLAGVVVVAVSALLLGGLLLGDLASAALEYTSVLVEASVGGTGLLVGAVLAIDPVRRYVRSVPSAIGVDRWRRRRLARQLARAAKGTGTTPQL